MTNEQPLTLAAYQEAAISADRSRDDTLNVPLLGLFGETGGLLSVAKKKQRDRASFLGYGPALIEELGDVLWYFTVTAARAGLNLSDIAANLGSTLSEWSTGTTELQFCEIQDPPNANPLEPTREFESTLLELAGEVGTLMSDHRRLKNNQPALPTSSFAYFLLPTAGVPLERSYQNLDKIFDLAAAIESVPAA